MKIFKQLIAASFFGLMAIGNAIAMQPSQNNISNNIIIKDAHGKEITLPKHIACKSDVIKTMLEDTQESEDSAIQINNIDSTTLATLFNFMQRNKAKVDNHNIIRLFNAADYLNIPIEEQKKLAQLLLKKIPHREIDPVLCKQAQSLAYTSITDVKDKIIIWTIIGTIDASGLQLDRLDGLENLCKTTQEQEKIIALYLHHNNLTNIDIKRLIKIFPNLRTINMSYNKLRELDIDQLQNLNSNSEMLLVHNNIDTIKQSNHATSIHSCHINLDHNFLTQDQLNNLVVALHRAPFFLKNRHNIASIVYRVCRGLLTAEILSPLNILKNILLIRSINGLYLPGNYYETPSNTVHATNQYAPFSQEQLKACSKRISSMFFTKRGLQSLLP